MTSALDPFTSGKFPVCVATHDHGLRRLFDLATLLLLLDCRPGERVLDLGAGSGFSSEMLARLGYVVIAADPDLQALVNTRRRPTFDPLRIEGTVSVAAAVAESLPFANAIAERSSRWTSHYPFHSTWPPAITACVSIWSTSWSPGSPTCPITTQ